MRKSTEADGKYSPRALAGPVPGSPKPSRSRSRVPKCGSSNQIVISIAPFLEDAAPNSFHRRLRNSVNGDHRNASFVGGTDKRCSRVLRRNFPMNCMLARANRYKVLFSVVDRPTNCQHLGSLEKSCDKLVFFRTLTTNIRGANSADVHHFMTLGLPTVNILVTVQEPFRDLRSHAEARFGGRIMERRIFLKGRFSRLGVASVSMGTSWQGNGRRPHCPPC
jgi:hypothetical protein